MSSIRNGRSANRPCCAGRLGWQDMRPARHNPLVLRSERVPMRDRLTHPRGSLRLKITSDPANLAPVRRAVEQFCREHRFNEAAVNEIGLVVNEAMANVIRHAYAGAVDRPIEVN